MEFLRKLFSVCLISFVLTGYFFAQDSEKKSEESFSAEIEMITCKEWSCGPNEACVDDKKAGPACQCNKGFSVVNNSCMPDECLDSDCPENGFCTADYGFAECGCPEGYYLEEYNGYKYCLFEEFRNETALIVENPAECQSLGLCRVKLNLEFPGSMIDKNSLGSYYITVGESGEAYENVPFAGYLTDCIKDGFCDDVTAQYITFNMVFPVEGKRDISVDLIGKEKLTVNERTAVEIISIADACDYKTCPEGSWCEVEGDFAFCRGNVPESEGSLSQLMSESEKSKDSKSGGGGMLLMGMVAEPEEQFWYHLSESAPGTSSCQNAPSLGGTFCGEYFPIVLPPLVRGVYITPGSTGITRTTSASNFDYILSSVTVYATITHPYTSDLVIKIISPSGTEKTVFNRVSGTNVTLEVNVTDFNNENPEGTWSIKVVDNYNNPTYVGYLTSWGVKLNSSGYKRINDASTYKRHGSYNGALFETGVISNAVGFDGTDDRIWAGSYIIPDSVTVTGWVYPDSVTGVTKEIIHARKWAEAEDPKIRVMIYENKLRAYVNSTYLQSTASISASTWTHIAVSFEKINTTQTRVKIYLNNVLDSEDVKTAVAASNQGMWNLGAYLNGNYTYQRFFDGKLDEFRVYNSVLSRYQRDLVYDYGCSTNYYRRSNKTCYNTASCGDGRLTGSEECEDASENDCSATCTYIQNNGLYPTACLNSCENEYYYTTTICGDTYVAGAETCDDGNAVVDICPVYNQSCTVCGDECTSEAGIMEYCGDGNIQSPYEECEQTPNCNTSTCNCNLGYEPHENPLFFNITCESVCLNFDCGTTGTCDNSTGVPVCSCGYGYVARDNYCVEGWFEDENMAAAVVEILQYDGYPVDTELDIDPDTMLADIEYLDLSSKNIESIVGIGLFTSLSVLDVSRNSISDLSPLGNNSLLASLNISGNPVRDASPLSALNLSNLNISNSEIFNIVPITAIDTLEIFTVEDSNYDEYTLVKPSATDVADWLLDQNGMDCNKLVTVELVGNKWVKRESNSDCSGGGVCIMGQCVCTAGYVEYDGGCYLTQNCPAGFHDEVGKGCQPNEKAYPCKHPFRTKIVSDSNLVWNGTKYAVPSMHNTFSCRNGDNTPTCLMSICRWECAEGHTWVKGDICEPAAYRDIPGGSYNQMILPGISRQDVVLEPVPGIPSFAPVMKAGLYYEEHGDYALKSGWHLDIPRVEFGVRIHPFFYDLFLHDWDHKSVSVNMPWGKEEYSILADKKCFNEGHELISPCSDELDLSNSAWVELTFFPSPGQNVFSYIVIKTRGNAAYGSFIYGSELFPTDPEEEPDPEIDSWTVERYGDDGSVAKFFRNQIRPGNFSLMDYIPISEYLTRDNKKTVFSYDWRAVNKYANSQEYSHYILDSMQITDPLKRVIKVSSSGSGLMGSPDRIKLHSPLENGLEIYTANADANNVIVTGTLKKVAEYEEIEGFKMRALILKNGDEYRLDEYSIDSEGKYFLSSFDSIQSILGLTTWEFTRNENNEPSGYIEKRLIKPNSNEEYSIKKVKGSFVKSIPGKDFSGMPYSTRFYSLNSGSKVTTVYSVNKNGQETGERIVEDYINNWFQPVEKRVCDYNTNENCDNDTTAAIEKVRYNVNGSPVYFKNADGQTSMDLYNGYFLSAENYNTFYFNYSLVAINQLRYAGKIKCSGKYSRDSSRDFEDILSDYVYYGTVSEQNWCTDATDLKAAAYLWEYESSGKPYDLQTVTYPDGQVKTFKYDYEISSSLLPAGYTPRGKVWGETLTGRDNVNELETCYKYNSDYQLEKQGIGTPENCEVKKGFEFLNKYFLKRDYSIDQTNEILNNYYYYDTLGRKVGETNSAGVTTVYYYDTLNRVVQTDFGCTPGVLYNNLSLYAAEDYTGVAPLGGLDCEYSRYYEYDQMNNLTDTEFEEKYLVSDTPSISMQTSNIYQTTKYDLIGRPVSNCQQDDPATPEQLRCIYTEHDIFGNITKKIEKGEERVVTYDHRDRPHIVTVDNFQIEEYEYNSAYQSGGFYGYDKIINRYDKELITYFDKWGRAAKQTDPFLNDTFYTYDDSHHSENILSQNVYSGSLKTGETVWTYDDLGRKLTETRKQFEPGANEAATTVNHGTRWNYDGIGNIIYVENYSGSVVDSATEYNYDNLNRLDTIANYENDGASPVSYIENTYNIFGRLSLRTVSEGDNYQMESFEYDILGRSNKVCKANEVSGFNDPRCSYRIYNTGGQVIWEADEEAKREVDAPLGIFENELIGNEKYYKYNEFGDIEKTIYVMTDDGFGRGGADPNDWLTTNGKITTSYVYDEWGRIETKTNDRSGTTTYSYYNTNEDGNWTKNRLSSIQITPAPNDGDASTNLSLPERYTSSGTATQLYEYTYDENGDEYETIYTEGEYSMTVTLGRDGYGRITSKTSDGSYPVTQYFSYDNNGVDRNLLISAQDSSGVTVSRSYDSFGIPYSEIVTYDSVQKTVSRKMVDSKTYQFTYPDGVNKMQKVTTGGRLDAINYGTGSTPPAIATYTREYGYLTGMTKGSGATPPIAETFSYNEWNKLSNHTVNDGSNDIYDMSYSYSTAWHLTEKADGMTNKSDKYTYDSYYRLKQVDYDYSSTPQRTDTFIQDGVHNLEQSVENSVLWNWGVDKLNRLREKKAGSTLAVEYDYDERNNMIFEDHVNGTANDRIYVYDDLNRLIQVKNGSNVLISAYKYDAFNRRIMKIDYTEDPYDQAFYRYTYDDWNVAEIEKSIDDRVTKTNVIDAGMDDHIAIYRKYYESEVLLESGMYYFLTDERGNIVALTDEDGTILERYRYRVYGEHEVINSCHALCETTYQSCYAGCGNDTCRASCLATKNTCDTTCAASDYAGNIHNFLWGGSLYEPETGLYWMRNRYYHVGMHRFINEDPIGIWGDANNLGNGFAYVAGMVIEASDPSGLATDFNSCVDKNEIVVESHPVDKMIGDIIFSSVLLGAAPGGAMGKLIGKVGKLLGPGGEMLLATVAAVGVMAYQFVTLPDKLNDMADSARDSAVGFSANELGFSKEERTDEKFTKGVTKDGNSFVGSFTFTDKSGNKWQIDLTYGTDGKKQELHVYKNGKLVKKYKWQVIGKDDKGNNIYGWVEVPTDSMPLDPDESEDAMQNVMIKNVLKKMLRTGEKKSFQEMMEEEGPVIKYDDNGRRVFVFNPYYHGKDPMKEIIWRVQDENGLWGFVRNPFAPGTEYGYDHTTAKKITDSKFNPGNIDPYFE